MNLVNFEATIILDLGTFRFIHLHGDGGDICFTLGLERTFQKIYLQVYIRQTKIHVNGEERAVQNPPQMRCSPRWVNCFTKNATLRRNLRLQVRTHIVSPIHTHTQQSILTISPRARQFPVELNSKSCISASDLYPCCSL